MIDAVDLHEAADDPRMQQGPEAFGLSRDALREFLISASFKNAAGGCPHPDPESIAYGIALGCIAQMRKGETDEQASE